ncbi:bacitracin ABC transporter ATP-binding protein [Clostridia bacterium]|nr:bacitracin ABC transporter ATP-binding protein [Clostridia bacterium]
MEYMIEMKDVVKKFKNVYALDGLNLNVEKGGILGLLGHNGAGKTTILRTILGLYKPDSGDVRVFGKNPEYDISLRGRTGVLCEDSGLYESLTLYENLVFFAKVYRMKKEDYDARIDYFLEEFSISDKKNLPVKGFSAGMKKKTAIIRTLMHNPDLVLLDEPTNALDPVSIDKFHGIVQKMSREDGTSFIITTHNLDEVKKICSDISIIKQGKCLYNQNLKDTRELYDMFETVIECVDGNKITLKTTDPKAVAKAIRELVEGGADICEARRNEFDLEKLYLSLAKE